MMRAALPRPRPPRRAWRACLLFVLFLILTACEGLPSMPHTVKAADYFSGTALPAALACEHDDADALDQALTAARLSPNAVGQQGMSLLLLALSNRSQDAMLRLLARGADPNLETKLGRDQTPVQPVGLAAGGAEIDLLRLLLDHGGNPNSRLGDEPATFRAADADRYDQMRLLIERGADLNATDKKGHTLMVQLADLRRYDQVAYLIQRGGDVHKADRVGGTVAFDVQTDLSDYKEVEGVKMPYSITQQFGTVLISSIKVNQTIPESVFKHEM